MRKIKHFFIKNAFLRPSVGGMMLVASLSVALITLIFSLYAKQDFLNKNVAGTQMDLAGIAGLMEIQESQVYQMIQTDIQKREVERLFDLHNDVAVASGMRTLSELRQRVKHLQSVYLFNQHKYEMYVTTADRPWAVITFDQFEDASLVQIIENIDHYPEFSPIVRQVGNETIYTYLLYDRDENGVAYNIMALNFHQNWMQEMLRCAFPNGDAVSICIFDGNQGIIYKDPGFSFDAVGGINQFAAGISHQPSGYQIVDSGEEGKKIFIWLTSAHAGYEQWIAVSASDYSEIPAQVAKLCRIFYAVSLLMLMGSIILLWRKFIALRKQLADASGMHQDGEEDNRQSIEREIFLRNLFIEKSQKETEQINKRLSEIGIEYSIDRENRVLLFSVDSHRSFILRFHERLEETENEIENILGKILRNRYEKSILIKIQNAWAACIPAGSDEKDLNELQELLNQVNQELTEKQSLSVSIAVSSQGNSVNEISECYAEAEQLLSYRFLMGYGQLLTLETTKDYGNAQFDYPQSAEKKLITCLKAGNQEEAVKAYDSFVNQVRFCPVDDARMAFVPLLNAIKCAFDDGIVEIPVLLKESDEFQRRLDEAETLEDVNRLFQHLIWDIIAKIQENSLKKYQLLVDQVKAYVAENYGKITFCMNEVAQHVGMSAAYLGRIFRQLNDMTFSDYLTKYRLDAACDLIVNTDKTITEISGLVGFTNCSYFYIVFKKHMNCTPNQYRQQNKPGEQIGDDETAADEE